MRQAGRYLPEYRKIRGKVDFLTLCKTPALAAEVTIQPVDILNVDAAILFSDILIPVEAIGIKLEFSEAKGPIIYNPIRDGISVDRLRLLNPEADVPFVMDAIKLLLKHLDVPLIGFSGAPFTLATYMIEGGSSKNFIHSKSMMYQNPGLFHKLMERLTLVVTSYLRAQIDAGVHAVQIFDSWAGVLSPFDFRDFALPYVQRIITSLDTKVPVIYFPLNTSAMLPLAKESGADVLGIDWRIEIADAVETLGDGIAVQGNLDPTILFGERETIRERVALILKGAAKARGHIFNLGHGILPETPVDRAVAMVEAVHEISLNNR